ncbi:Beta-adaptin-like protein C [Fusarium oxysporum f. sp. albedinis]|nr:Beta-adaptin-like protein C [Fusarium oxysporum f. sp. albedinis]
MAQLLVSSSQQTITNMFWTTRYFPVSCMNRQSITTNYAFSSSSTFGVYVASDVFATRVKPDTIKVVDLRRCPSSERAPCCMQ